MGAFEDVHRDRITGSLAMFDRMIFKGHLGALYKQDGARCFLWSQGVALKDFTEYAKATTERIANNARKLVTDAGRPVISFDHVKTRNRTQHKDELAKSIAEHDGITEGIICLITAVETCFSFQVRKRYESGKLELFRRERKCLRIPAISYAQSGVFVHGSVGGRGAADAELRLARGGHLFRGVVW